MNEASDVRDAVASWYDEWVAAPEKDLLAVTLFELIGPVEGERILDLGCGQGRIARVLAARGNDVLGVDLSAELLGIGPGIGHRPDRALAQVRLEATDDGVEDGAFGGVRLELFPDSLLELRAPVAEPLG